MNTIINKIKTACNEIKNLIKKEFNACKKTSSKLIKYIKNLKTVHKESQEESK